MLLELDVEDSTLDRSLRSLTGLRTFADGDETQHHDFRRFLGVLLRVPPCLGLEHMNTLSVAHEEAGLGFISVPHDRAGLLSSLQRF